MEYRIMDGPEPWAGRSGEADWDELASGFTIPRIVHDPTRGRRGGPAVEHLSYRVDMYGMAWLDRVEIQP